MKKNRSLLIFLSIFLVLLIAAYILYSRLSSEYGKDQLVTTPSTETVPDTQSPSPETPETENKETEEEPPLEAPDFTVYDRDGNPVKLSDFEGKPVLLNFWASWCGPCKHEMPVFEEAYKTYGEDIHFVLVNLTDGQRETVEKASSYVDGEGYTFPIYFDSDMEGAMTYGVTGVPVSYFINAEGHLIAQAGGSLDAETLQRGIDLLLPPAEE